MTEKRSIAIIKNNLSILLYKEIPLKIKEIIIDITFYIKNMLLSIYL